MAAATTTTTLVNQYQAYFSRMLLQYAVQATRLAEFATKAPLPQRAGVKDIRFFKYNAPIDNFGTSGVTEGNDGIKVLSTSEGVAPTNFRQLTQTAVNAELVQYGQVVKLTDILRMTEFFNSLEQATKLNGEDAALHMDSIIRNEIITASVAANKTYSGGATSHAALIALSVANGTFVAIDALDACTKLKINRAPTIGGGYIAIAAPQITRDLMNDNAWLNAKQYSDVTDLYKAEAGSLYGIRFVEGTNPWVEDTVEDTYDEVNTLGDGKLVYATIFTGDQAYGCPELTGNSPMSPSVIITDKADKSDPLNQLTTVGFKSFWVAKALNTEYYVTHRSFSGKVW